MVSKRIAVILGARPNFVKAAAFFKEAKKHPQFKFTTIHTGQHYDKEMSDVFFNEMQLPRPDISLDIKSDLHTEKIGKTFSKLKDIFSKENFDAVIVFGDVNSTLAGGIAAARNHCKLIHIEAGLRSHDRRMPEEINRAVVDHLSDLLFTTEPSANNNLLKEGINPEKVKYVGNIMTENIEIFKDKINSSDIVGKLGLLPKKYVIATIHRQENTDSLDNLKKIISVLSEINKDTQVVFSLHPGTEKRLIDYGLSLDNLKVIRPLGYFEFMKLIIESKGVITDSGGIQEETTYLSIPCCTLRDNTERPITVELGSNKLFPLNQIDSVGVLKHLNRSFEAKKIALWDDKVSERIFKHLNESI